MKEELLISLRAGQMARVDTLHLQSSGKSSLAHAFDRPFVQGSFPHDASTADISAVELKLRLDQDQVLRLGTSGCGHSGKHLGDGNERNIHGHKAGGLRNLLRPKIACIRLDLRDTSILLQAPRNLLRRHVDCVNAARAMSQQAIGEASGGRSYIEADFPVHVDSEIFECALQLQTTAARIFCRNSADFNTRVLADLRAGFFAPLSVHANFSSKDHGLRLFTRFGEASFDDQQVEPLFCGLGFGWQGNPVGQGSAFRISDPASVNKIDRLKSVPLKQTTRAGERSIRQALATEQRARHTA